MPGLKLDSGKPERFAILALVVIGLVAYLDCLGNDFIFDDIQYINAETFSPYTFEWLTTSIESPIKGRPLVGLSLLLNFMACGLKPAGYHFFNLVVHLTCSLALFGVVRRALLHWRSPRHGGMETIGLAFACALLWMIHPIQSECVNYISQRTESMASLFILLSMYCAIRSYETTDRTRWVVAAGAATWAGALCKETAALGPVLILLLDMSLAKHGRWQLIRERVVLYATVFSSWVVVATLMTVAPRATTVGVGEGVTILQYASNQFVLLVEYLRLVAWPDALVIDYGRPRELPLVEVIPAAIAISALLALTLTIYRRRPAVGFLGLSAFLLLAPTSSVIPIVTEVGAERRMYLPLATIVVLFVLGVQYWSRRAMISVRRSKFKPHTFALTTHRAQAAVCTLLLIAIAVPLGLRTVERNREYEDQLKLWTDAVLAYPDNSRAWNWLASEFLQVDPSTAERVTAEMAKRWSDDASVSMLAGYHYLGLHENYAKAAECFRRVLELDPTHAKAKVRLVWLLSASADDELRDGHKALEYAISLTEQYPDEPELLDALAMAQAECGDFEAATTTAEEAIAKSSADQRQAATIEFRLAGYRRQLPIRLSIQQEVPVTN